MRSFIPPLSRRLVSPLMAALLAASGLAHAQCGNEPAGAAPAAQIDTALWPADVVRRAEAFLRQHPDDPQRARVDAERDGAAQAMQALQQRDVRLQRTAFCSEAEQAGDDLRLAARGDRDAALRIAHRYRGQTVGVEAHRYEGWLQFAAALGHEGASYELALHYRRVGQPVYAAMYEARAVQAGFVVPSALDHVRK
jgi:hypothetical protein